MKAKVDKTTCMACAVCVEICPEVFEIDDDGTATVKVDPVPGDVEQTCREAAEQCPSEAIQVEEE